jgi:hypothetical protein
LGRFGFVDAGRTTAREMSMMNMPLLPRILYAYLLGLAGDGAFDALEHAVGHVHDGVPTDLLRIAPLLVACFALPLTDPNWRRQRREYVVIAVAVLLLGSSLVGLVLLAGFHWEGGAARAMADVAFGSGLAVALSIVGRSWFGRASSNSGNDRGSGQRPGK